MTAPLTIRWLGRYEYCDALALQEQILQDIRAGTATDTLLLLEHPPVYTIGHSKNRTSLGIPSMLPHPLQEINRGGQATFHGIGQLVGYPILRLDAIGRDLHRYLRFLEEFLIALADFYGVSAERREGLTGSWVKEKKIASIGIGVRHWISMHGFGLNVTPKALEGFQHIIPCGITSVQMTDLSTESKKSLTVEEVATTAGIIFSKLLAKEALSQVEN